MKKIFLILYCLNTLVIFINGQENNSKFKVNDTGTNNQSINEKGYSSIRKDQNLFLDFNNIIYKKDIILKSDTFSLNWGEDILMKMELQGLSTYEKAKKINQYINNNFPFTSKRYLYLQDIIHKGEGNCRSHANLSIFLLRLAGIPAKCSHEMHIIKKSFHSIYIGYRAKKAGEGINGYTHNDHMWVWFFDGNNWLPFDSSLGITGYDELINKRFIRSKGLNKRYIEKITGPPFVVWEDSGFGFDSMTNISISLFSFLPENVSPVSKTDWIKLTSIFLPYDRKEFYKGNLPKDLSNEIKKIRNKFFFRK